MSDYDGRLADMEVVAGGIIQLATKLCRVLEITRVQESRDGLAVSLYRDGTMFEILVRPDGRFDTLRDIGLSWDEMTIKLKEWCQE